MSETKSMSYKNKEDSRFIKWLTEIGKEDLSLVGGKGGNLGELRGLGVLVPRAFCVTTEAFKGFIEENELKDQTTGAMEGLEAGQPAQLREMTRKVQDLVLSHPIPESVEEAILEAYHELAGEEGNRAWVAVRSSATAEDLPTASFAGQMATYLNVRGDQNVLKALQECWAALFGESATTYRDQHRFKHTDVSMGVIIQEMVEADESGVMFTIHPVTKDHDKIVIEANFGLGETVVGGAVTPDTFVVNKQTLEVLEEYIGSKKIMVVRGPKGGTIRKDTPMAQRSKPSLTTEEIQKVAEFGRRIEQHYNYPQDIEWAISKDNIYIVQTRPVTAL